jgi:hypothetical protein
MVRRILIMAYGMLSYAVGVHVSVEDSRSLCFRKPLAEDKLRR